MMAYKRVVSIQARKDLTVDSSLIFSQQCIPIPDDKIEVIPFTIIYLNFFIKAGNCIHSIQINNARVTIVTRWAVTRICLINGREIYLTKKETNEER